MAKDVKFNIKLSVDGKDVVVQASTNVQNLADKLGIVHDRVTAADKAFIKWSQSVIAIQSIQQSLTQLSGAMQTLTGDSFAYNKAMRAANTMAGKDAAGFEALTDDVTELAKQIPIARDELANGLYMVISNGVPEDNWINYLEKSAKASVGGLADLQKVVTVTSTIIKNYGLEWEAAGEIQDKIQLTAKNGVTSFEQLADALPSVAGSAAQLGITIEELMAIFATCTGVTGNTAEVSTQLGAVLKALIKPSTEAAKAAEQMGIKFDAAAIKEAGGLDNFLKSLDKAINEYSARTGELSETIYGTLFGSARALRLLTSLTGEQADKFTQNIGEMTNSAGTMDGAFEQMSSTGAAKLKMLENQLGKYRDMVASVFGNVMPIINFTATLGLVAMTFESLRKSAVMLWAGIGRLTQATAAGRAVKLLWTATAVRMNAVTQVMAASFKGAAVSARTLRLAIEGLLIVGGITAAWVVLTEVLTLFSDKSEEAAKSSQELQEAEEAFTRTLADSKMTIEADIKKLQQLIDTKADTTAAVKALNEKYGELLGTYSTGAEWLTTLKDKSDDYCQQLAIEAKTDTIRRKIFEKNAELMMIAEKKRRLEESGEHRTRVSKTVGTTSAGTAVTYNYEDYTSEYKALMQQETELTGGVAELQKEFDIANTAAEKHRQQMKKTGEEAGGAANGVNYLTMSYAALGEAIEKQKNKVSALAGITGKESEAKTEAKKLREMEARYKALGKKYGLDKSGNSGKRTIVADPKTLEELRTNIDLTKKKLTDADTAEQRQLREQIKLWQKKANAIELSQKKAAMPVGAIDEAGKVDTTKIQTETDVKTVIEYLNALKQVATTKKELSDIDAQIATVELRQAELQRPDAGVLKSLLGNTNDETIRVNVEQGSVELPEVPTDDKTIKVNVAQGDVNLPEVPTDDKVIKVNVEQGDVNLPEIPTNDETIRVNVEQGSVDLSPLETLQAIDKELEYQRALRKTVAAEQQGQIDDVINRLETLKKHVENAGVIRMDDSALKTYDQLAIKVQYYQDQLKNATAASRPELLRHIADLEKIRQQWELADKAATVETDVRKVSTLKEITDAISFLQEKQKTATAQEIQGIQQTIAALERKKKSLQIGIDIPDMQREIAEVNALSGRDYKARIKGFGFEELTKKIRDLQKVLADTENPVTDSQRKDIEGMIAVYEKWRKQSVSTFGAFKDGWSGIKGIGSGIESISNALEGNGNAWQKVTAFVDGFIQIVEGINTVIDIIDMLTTATTAHTVAKGAESAAIVTATTTQGVEAAAQEVAAAAAIPTIIANKALTASYVQLASAMYMAAHAYIPFAGFGIGAGFSAAAVAMVQAIGLMPFAEGGVVSGPTMALIGEYAGATNNPEVVAPLDKLRDMIEPQGEIFGKVRFELEGRKLVGVIEREYNHKKRS